VFLILPRDHRGEPVCTLIYSATQHYSRPDVAYVPVPDAELDQVHLASEATRRFTLITAFIRAAQQALPAPEIASAQVETAAPV
jgi:hypothetical protein